jgi:hypothetical protein
MGGHAMTRCDAASDYGLNQSIAKVLLLDCDHRHADALAGFLRSRGLYIEAFVDLDTAIARLCQNTVKYDVLIINVSGTSGQWRRVLERLHAACHRLDARQVPLFLCVSTILQTPEFVLQIERMGVRYVRER